MRTMIITIERTPRTLDFEGATIDVEELGIRLPFAHKPTDLDNMCTCGNAIVYVTETMEMTVTEFDGFRSTLLHPREWLKGKGGMIGQGHLCVEVHAPGRPYLYVDPAGADYARYVARLG
jgi:hypothetical protein